MRKVLGTAIGNVVAIDRRQDNVVDAPIDNSFGRLYSEKENSELVQCLKRRTLLPETDHTLKGSKGSGGGGAASVLTAQNMHPRVLRNDEKKDKI